MPLVDDLLRRPWLHGLDTSRQRAASARTIPQAADQRHTVFWSVDGLGELALVEGDYDSAQRQAEERGILAHPPGSMRLACLASAIGQHAVAPTLRLSVVRQERFDLAPRQDVQAARHSVMHVF